MKNKIILWVAGVAVAFGGWLGGFIDLNLGGVETQSFYTPTLSTAAVGPDLTRTVVATNTARTFLSISNVSTALVTLCLDASTCTTSKGIALFASSTMTFDPLRMPTGTITGKGTASTTLLITEK